MARRRCFKCGSRKNITRHHVYGKKGLCGLKVDSPLPLKILLTWLGIKWDEVDIFFWERDIIPLCRKCHDELHILLTRMLNKCDRLESELPLKEYMEEKNV